MAPLLFADLPSAALQTNYIGLLGQMGSGSVEYFAKGVEDAYLCESLPEGEPAVSDVSPPEASRALFFVKF